MNNLAATWVKIDEHFNAIQYFKKAKQIYKELTLNYLVKVCQKNIEICNQAIAAERRSPPTIDQAPKESTIEWYERQKQANQPMVYDRPKVIVRSAENDRKINRIF